MCRRRLDRPDDLLLTLTPMTMNRALTEIGIYPKVDVGLEFKLAGIQKLSLWLIPRSARVVQRILQQIQKELQDISYFGYGRIVR